MTIHSSTTTTVAMVMPSPGSARLIRGLGMHQSQLGVAETDAWNISTNRSLLEVQTLRPGSTGDESESAFLRSLLRPSQLAPVPSVEEHET